MLEMIAGCKGVFTISWAKPIVMIITIGFAYSGVLGQPKVILTKENRLVNEVSLTGLDKTLNSSLTSLFKVRLKGELFD